MEGYTIDWGSVPDWIVAIVAFAAALYARKQVQVAAVARSDAIELERANLLLRLDESFERPEMVASRGAWSALRSECEHEARSQNPHLSKDELIEILNRKISLKLNKLWIDSQSDSDENKISSLKKYMDLAFLINWLETLGRLARQNLVPEEDILDLYDVIIIKTVGTVEEHVKYRENVETVSTSRHWQNAFWLLARAKVFKTEKEAPRIEEPPKSLIEWNRSVK